MRSWVFLRKWFLMRSFFREKVWNIFPIDINALAHKDHYGIYSSQCDCLLRVKLGILFIILPLGVCFMVFKEAIQYRNDSHAVREYFVGLWVIIGCEAIEIIAVQYLNNYWCEICLYFLICIIKCPSSIHFWN